MSVTLIFNRIPSGNLSIEDAIHPRTAIFLKDDCLVDADGLILAERVVDQETRRVFWRVLAASNEPTFGQTKLDGLYQEVAIVGQGKLNL